MVPSKAVTDEMYLQYGHVCLKSECKWVPTNTYVFEYLVPSWWHCIGKLWNLLDRDLTGRDRAI